MWVTAVALQILLNDKYKLESLQGDGSRTRQEILKQPAAKLEPVIVAVTAGALFQCFAPLSVNCAYEHLTCTGYFVIKISNIPDLLQKYWQ